MRRKVIKQGHNTLTITLPSKWAQRFKLFAGEEIDVLERGNNLLLSTEKHTEELITEIDISNLDIPLIWKYFMAVYREGYDEVKVNFKNETFDSPYKFFTSHASDLKYETTIRKHSPFELIQEITNRFIGFEVIEHHKTYCIIKNMSEISSKEFDNSLRRVFLLLQQMMSEISDAVNSGDIELLKHTHDIDINVDKFHDYCVRVLNKTGFQDIKKTNILFSLLFLLEMVGDELKNIAFHIINDMKGKKLNNLTELCKLTFEHFRNFYDAFYKFDKSKVINLSKKDMEIYFYLPKIYKKHGNLSNLTNNKLEILNHFRRVTRYVNALIELRIEMEF